MSDGWHDGEGDGANGTDHAGPEEGGTLARRPAPVSDGLLPEEGRSAGHFGFCGSKLVIEDTDSSRRRCASTDMCSRGRGWVAVGTGLLPSRALPLCISCYSIK